MGMDDVRRLMACFYADNGLIVPRNPEDLQVAFDVLTGLFNRVGLRTNTTKTEAMVFLPGKIRTLLTVEAYEARMDDTFRAERTGRKVDCHICHSSRPHSHTMALTIRLKMADESGPPCVTPRLSRKGLP